MTERERQGRHRTTHRTAARWGVWTGRIEGWPTWRAVLWLVVVNLVLRGFWLAWMHPPQLYDFEWYFQHAVAMLHGLGYETRGQFTAYWPMGYPYFLSLLFRVTGAHVTAGLVANAMLSIGIVLVVYSTVRVALSRTDWPARTCAFAAAIGYTFLPSQVEWNSVLGSEELATFLLILSLCLYIIANGRQRWLLLTAAAGFVLGLSCDVRPIPLLFPVVILLFERIHRQRSWLQAAGRAGWFALAMCVAVSPLTVRNALVMHHFIVVSTNGGVNLWQGTHVNGYYFWSWHPWINPLLAAHGNEILQNQIGMHTAIHYMLRHPGLTIVHGFMKIYFLYWVDWNVIGVTFGAYVPKLAGWVGHAAAWFNTVVYWLWMSIAAAGISRFVRRQRRGRQAGDAQRMVGLWFLLWYILYNTAVFFFFPAWDRFRYPLMPLFAVFFGIAWVALRPLRYGRRRAK